MPLDVPNLAGNVPIGDLAEDALKFAQAREVGADARSTRAGERGLLEYHAEAVASDKLQNLERRFRSDPEGALAAYNADPDLVKRFGVAKSLGDSPTMIQIGNTTLVQDQSGKLVRIPAQL